MVVLLFPSGRYTQFLQARTAMNAPPNPNNLWSPYEPIQNLVGQLQGQEGPLSSTLINNTLGTFEFPAPIAPGNYLITVGIPTTRDAGQTLPKAWSPLLLTKKKVPVAGREMSMSTRSAWFAELNVKDSDRSVVLDKHDYVTWPELRPSGDDLRKIQPKLREIEGLDSKAKAAQTECDKAKEKALASGQPLHFKAMLEAESKAKDAMQARDKEVSKLDELFRQLIPDAEGPVESEVRTLNP